MFIKWRTYQRQKYHKKDDKYYLQPVLVHSARVPKKLFNEFARERGKSDEEFKDHWQEHKAAMNQPRHIQLFRFDSFSSCAYVHYDEPAFIEQRKDYWEMLDILFEHNEVLSELPGKEKAKILDEIEGVLPRPYGQLLEILERAYEAGMPKSQSLKEILKM